MKFAIRSDSKVITQNGEKIGPVFAFSFRYQAGIRKQFSDPSPGLRSAEEGK